MNIKSLGLEELSLSEKKNVNGGADYIWYKGTNGLIYFGVACFNGGVSLYNWITGEKAGCRVMY